MNYSEILDGRLYQGSYVLDYKELDKIKPDVVVNLSGIQMIEMPEFTKNYLYLYLPMEDGDVPRNIRLIAESATLVASTIAEDASRVYVYCASGLNRSSLFTGLVLNKLGIACGQELVDLVKRKRPGALINRSFADFLAGYPDYFKLKQALAKSAA